MPASTSLRRRRRRPIEVELTPIDGPSVADIAVRRSPTATCSTRRSRRLDPEWRAVVVLHYFLGMPLPEVAAALGIPLGTAKSRLHRSLAAMRVAIGDRRGRRRRPVPGGQFA